MEPQNTWRTSNGYSSGKSGGAGTRDRLGSRLRYGGSENATKATTTTANGTIQGRRHQLTDVRLGGLNTAILIISSLTMALGVRAAQMGDRRKLTVFMMLTLILGMSFLGIKAIEYHSKWEHHLIPGINFHQEGPDARQVQIFFSLYFATILVTAESIFFFVKFSEV